LRRSYASKTIVAGLWLVFPVAVSAQVSPLQVEVNVGAGVPVQEFAERAGFEGEAGDGATFGVHFALTTRSYLTWYVGFSQHRFGCDGMTCGAVDDIVTTSWDVGARVNLLSGPVVPWIRGGVVTHLAELDSTGVPAGGSTPVTVRLESDRGWGFEAGAGLMITVAPRLAINPGVTYSRVTTGFDGIGDLAMRFFSVDLGFVLGF
jgi:opacity protein-like surface antigen